MGRRDIVKNKQQPNKIQVSQFELSAGPLPHPDILRRYEEIVPGAAERIIAQAEKQTEHRISLEKKVIESDIKKERLGLFFGFFIGIVGIGGGIYLTTLGNNVFGPLLSGATLVSLVGTFIYGTQTRKKEREFRYRGSQN